MNLLLVDDEIAMLHIMEKAIDWKKKGIQKVFTAYNTDLARDIISSSKIDLVICDIEMPKENGLSLIQWIQQWKSWRSIKQKTNRKQIRR